MAKKEINGWNIPCARRLVDKERSTNDTIRIIVPSEGGKILRSFNVPKKFVTDNDKTKDYFYVWIPKLNWTQWGYSYSFEKDQYVPIGKKCLSFNQLVELLNICAHFTRQLIASIKNGLSIIKDKAVKAIQDTIALQKLFNHNDLKLKEANIELEQLVNKNYFEKQNENLKGSSPNTSVTEVKFDEEIDEAIWQ
ncbi:hypothetical protein [Mesoplasma melaleucae]|uniref:Uncharacterized protein n=1 Tax=Mesoplasma melaleucae TaxID=81459 RepID=A0A2K8NYL8_9MOLU|nr:hypothetical protein [Mesoplasma melaleucae]ATZ18288.1 hypothetical protein EMELA_v1c08010 [Mesoplasma melaleucae]